MSDSLLTKPLGLEGWRPLESVLLAAIISEEPLLLIGPHGSAKSFFLEKLSHALGLEFRFYNASLINYDDLVGIPIPAPDGRSLEYIRTPSTIWEAQVVFIDEINRTRPELQNKLFPIIHERRIQGINLDRLRYRWSAMNPPPQNDSAELSEAIYAGIEPLDTALADRFSFVVNVPGWQELSLDERRNILKDQFKGEHGFPVPLDKLIDRGVELLDEMQENPPAFIEEYLIHVLDLLSEQKVVVSARRATMLHRAIFAIHASRTALASFDDAEDLDWEDSCILALKNGLPGPAQGNVPDPLKLMAVHKKAWIFIKDLIGTPLEKVLELKKPEERCIAGYRVKPPLDSEQYSPLLIDALQSLNNENRLAFAWAAYPFLCDTKLLVGTAVEALAVVIRDLVIPKSASSSKNYNSTRIKEIENLIDTLNPDEKTLVHGALITGVLGRNPNKIVDSYREFKKKWEANRDGKK